APGLRDTTWRDDTRFDFRSQARTFAALVDALGLDRYPVLAHDTGASIGRVLWVEHTKRIRRIVLLNTEIPGHRPPWVPTYQRLTRAPGSIAIFRRLLASRAFCRS